MLGNRRNESHWFPLLKAKWLSRGNTSGVGAQAMSTPSLLLTKEELAASGQSVGFGFSAGGLLFPYYCGVIERLRETDMITDRTP